MCRQDLRPKRSVGRDASERSERAKSFLKFSALLVSISEGVFLIVICT